VENARLVALMNAADDAVIAYVAHRHPGPSGSAPTGTDND
jgi:hypothetical protein